MHWFIYRVNWMVLFGCRELINSTLCRHCQIYAGTMLPDWKMDMEQKTTKGDSLNKKKPVSKNLGLSNNFSDKSIRPLFTDI